MMQALKGSLRAKGLDMVMSRLLTALALTLLPSAAVQAQMLPADVEKLPPCSDRAVWKGSRLEISGSGRPLSADELRCYDSLLYVRKRGLWALFSAKAEPLTEFAFDELGSPRDGLIPARQGSRNGYLLRGGQTLVPLQYERIRLLDSGRFLARDSSGWSLLDRLGRPNDSLRYDKVSPAIHGFYVVQRQGLYGLLNEAGDVVVPPRYSEMHAFFEGLAMVSRNGKWGHIDEQGREVIPLEYDEIFVFYDGLCIARRGPHWGYINRQNEPVLPFVFDHVEYFHGGRALVSRGGLWGYISREGRELIPIRYDRIHPFHNGLARVEEGGLTGVIDEQGRVVIPVRCEEIYPFENGLAIVREQGRYGFVRSDGQVLVKPVWDAVTPFVDGLARVQSGSRFGLINPSGQVLIPAEYEEIGLFQGGMVSVRQGESWMFLDAVPGQQPAPLDVNRAARVRMGADWGYIDQSGRTFGFGAHAVEFVDTWASLGSLEASDRASYTFHFRNNGESSLTLEELKPPCGCELLATPRQGVGPGQFGQIHLNCETLGIEPEWSVRVPVRFRGLQDTFYLGMQANRALPESARQLMEEVPVLGRYVFLMDISGSMDELPLAKMVFTRLASSLCREDNIAIVSFNSFSKVELRPTDNHSEVISTLRNLRPALKTDAARGLRVACALLGEPGRAREKHIYMASDGDIQPDQLLRILGESGNGDVQLTVFIFSYPGDRRAYERLSELGALRSVRFVYVDRENIAEVLDEEYTDIGCQRQELNVQAALPYTLLEKAPYGQMSTIRERRRLGAVDAQGNTVLPPIYEQLDYPGEGLVRTRLGKFWKLHRHCEDLTPQGYDSIGNFQYGKAVALRGSRPVLLDRQGREHQFVPDWHSNPFYPDPDALSGQPPVNLVLLLDISSSMDMPDRLPLLQETFGHFSGLLRYEDRVGVVAFSQNARVVLPSVPAHQRKTLIDTLSSLRSRGGTEVLTGLDLAYRQASENYLAGGNNRIILATDGRFDMTDELLKWMDRLRARNIHLSIYLFNEQEKRLSAEYLHKLAERAGGHYRHATPDNIATLLLEEARILGQLNGDP